jgi:hypothetical protein
VAAKQYYETAANLGDTDAMNEVAWCYLEGFGTKKDKVSARPPSRDQDGAPFGVPYSTDANTPVAVNSKLSNLISCGVLRHLEIPLPPHLLGSNLRLTLYSTRRLSSCASRRRREVRRWGIHGMLQLFSYRFPFPIASPSSARIAIHSGRSLFGDGKDVGTCPVRVAAVTFSATRIPHHMLGQPVHYDSMQQETKTTMTKLPLPVGPARPPTQMINKLAALFLHRPAPTASWFQRTHAKAQRLDNNVPSLHHARLAGPRVRSWTALCRSSTSHTSRTLRFPRHHRHPQYCQPCKTCQQPVTQRPLQSSPVQSQAAAGPG